ncbi:hypothetical protein A2363_00745 [Candidatus Gottesmanbacteria bacterium RIFOXYB1_FULL_47_11]|uniref:Uncharacterized protein n=1 Tax=Candidatus Gottesmanbacteria bacterium RIFOXYB1_FULL_47_11 TaxID=1798401 RepID=A0A1F6BGE4_9BACT|nr:MAG: hypothetical protein A2363_00745 [Candidatus Gottesmanbacteria bacterium RIFOXYB1_FULL_47_11]
MQMLNKDARGFIDNVAKYISRGPAGRTVLPKVQTLFSKVTTQAKKERFATVRSAVALTDAEKASIAKTIARILGHEVECHFHVNPEILAGISVTVADWVVDSSFATQLAAITHSLSNDEK